MIVYLEEYKGHEVEIVELKGMFRLLTNRKFHNRYASVEQAVKISSMLIDNQIY